MNKVVLDARQEPHVRLERDRARRVARVRPGHHASVLNEEPPSWSARCGPRRMQLVLLSHHLDELRARQPVTEPQAER
jgi:hypothetical protein